MMTYSHKSKPIETATVQLHPRDNVAIAKQNLAQDVVLIDEAGTRVVVGQAIPSGHKIALEAIPAGQAVRRYGQVIGLASSLISPGNHVHTHNLEVGGLDRDYAFGVDARSPSLVPQDECRTFQGYLRPDGRVGTRNVVAVISTVNCSAHAARRIAHHFTAERLSPYPNVDSVVAFTHPYGCAVRAGGRDYAILQRTLAGIACHPNVAAYILVGLGCEVNQVDDQADRCELCGGVAIRPGQTPGLVIQSAGGIRKTVAEGVDAIEAMLPEANDVYRTPQPLSALTLALQCGGSDGWSGVTANPIVGLVADELVRQGGAVVLAETPEITGAEHLLTRRAVDARVGQALVDQVRWWEALTRRMGVELDDNRSVGNAAGGLTTIYEKSLGAIAKAGSTPLTAVVDYAGKVIGPGFVFMNTPGNDPVSVTGQVAGGCNLVLFTTGRGSVFGFQPAPSIKISTNTPTYERMIDDIDLDAGRVLTGASLPEVADELLDLVVAVASGQPSKSEAQGVGEAEFCPWQIEGTL